MRDLLTNVVEQYAIYWEELGQKLGLADYQLANVYANHAACPSRRVETCCRDVLERWLKEVTSPTWGKLDDAIKSLTIVPAQCMSAGPQGIANYMMYENIIITTYRN